MEIKALYIYLGKELVGTLFKYGTNNPIIRFVAHERYVNRRNPPTLSLSMLTEDPEQQRAFWADVTQPVFNGTYTSKNGFLLPAFFQGLLPEGVFRDHVAAERHCAPNDHFEMLAATGDDLPGNVYARNADLTPEEMAHLVTQDADSLEMSVTAAPMEAGVSVSGLQPKLAALKEGERYVARTRLQDTRIIAKLPVVGYARLPELEDLSLRLAAAAGVNVCEAHLEPLEKLAMEHGYDLGDDATGKTNFLAVVRFDRPNGKNGRYHVEDFGQILEIEPENKYDSSYLEIAGAMLDEPSLGEEAVKELLRRMTVNELMGNPDMHVKNLGVIYRDGVTPELSPAYDIVGYSAYGKREGHGLFIVPPMLLPAPPAGKPVPKQQLRPTLVRKFAELLELVEKPLQRVIRDTVRKAIDTWPEMIQDSLLTEKQKTNMLAYFESRALVLSARKRMERHAVVEE